MAKEEIEKGLDKYRKDLIEGMEKHGAFNRRIVLMLIGGFVFLVLGSLIVACAGWFR